ncbi:conserved exported hypothetical protein [Paraburkholderia tropica]
MRPKALLTYFFIFPCFLLQTAQALAAQIYICGYVNDKTSMYNKDDVVISVDGETVIAVACAPVSSAYRSRFHVVENNSTDVVFSAEMVPGLGKGPTSVFGLDRRTGRLYHCVNRFRMPSEPVWIATCFQASKHQII